MPRVVSLPSPQLVVHGRTSEPPTRQRGADAMHFSRNADAGMAMPTRAHLKALFLLFLLSAATAAEAQVQPQLAKHAPQRHAPRDARASLLQRQPS